MLTAAQIEHLKSLPASGPNRLAAAMELGGVTQVQLAQATGHTQPYVSSIVNGKYSALPLETARRIADAFGCAIEDLFPAPGDGEAVNS